VPHSTRPSAALGPVPHSAHAVTRPCARACVARESARGCAGERVRMGARARRLHDGVRACVRACVRSDVRRRAQPQRVAARPRRVSARAQLRSALAQRLAALTPRHPSGCMLHVASLSCMLHPCLACCILSLHVASFPCMLHPFLACCILSLHVASFPCMLHPVSGRMCYACCCRGGLCLRRAWRLATRAAHGTAFILASVARCLLHGLLWHVARPSGHSVIDRRRYRRAH
jgi:hypothetical protein